MKESSYSKCGTVYRRFRFDALIAKRAVTSGPAFLIILGSAQFLIWFLNQAAPLVHARPGSGEYRATEIKRICGGSEEWQENFKAAYGHFVPQFRRFQGIREVEVKCAKNLAVRHGGRLADSRTAPAISDTLLLENR